MVFPISQRHKVGEIFSRKNPGISPMSSMMGMQWSVPMWYVAQAPKLKGVVGESPARPIISWNVPGFQ